ncbi:MAG: hypothetical protein IT367_12460 [Candidatus Hydrogenedentes bacterium]|nr:hypothetical protein [Candidatus Hydrogenedentota bacterium]
MALSASAENLLKNGSFEVVSDGAPADWSVFVEPKDGAASFFDQRVAKEGSNSVKLSLDSPYIEDPANNWSQNVLTDVRGKHLRLKGSIKTDNASEAAIWVQCYSKNPLKLVLQESTSSRGLLTGTNDWSPVEVDLTAPADTDFVVVRCVLRFRGVAWFDDISLEAEAGPTATPTATIPKPAVAKDAPVLKMPTPPSMPALPDLSASTTTKPAEPKTAVSDELLKATEEMRKVNWQLRQSNAAMSKQLEELRTQVESLKRQIAETSVAAKELKEEQSKPIEREKAVEVPPPPLIPDEDTATP